MKLLIEELRYQIPLSTPLKMITISTGIRIAPACSTCFSSMAVTPLSCQVYMDFYISFFFILLKIHQASNAKGGVIRWVKVKTPTPQKSLT